MNQIFTCDRSTVPKSKHHCKHPVPNYYHLGYYITINSTNSRYKTDFLLYCLDLLIIKEQYKWCDPFIGWIWRHVRVRPSS